MKSSVWWTPCRPPPDFTTVSGISTTAQTVWQALLRKHRRKLVQYKQFTQDRGVDYYEKMYQRRFGVTPRGAGPQHCSSQNSTVDQIVNLPSSAQVPPLSHQSTQIYRKAADVISPFADQNEDGSYARSQTSMVHRSVYLPSSAQSQMPTHQTLLSYQSCEIDRKSIHDAPSPPLASRNKDRTFSGSALLNSDQLASDECAATSCSPLLDLSSDEENTELKQDIIVGNFTLQCVDFDDISDNEAITSNADDASTMSGNRISNADLLRSIDGQICGKSGITMASAMSSSSTINTRKRDMSKCGDIGTSRNDEESHMLRAQISHQTPLLEDNVVLERHQIRLGAGEKSRLNFSIAPSSPRNIVATPIASHKRLSEPNAISHNVARDSKEIKKQSIASSLSHGFRPPLKRKKPLEQSLEDVQLKRFDKILDGMHRKDATKDGRQQSRDLPGKSGSADKSCSGRVFISPLVAVKSLSDDEREQLVSELNDAEEIALTLVYEDGSSQLRDLTSAIKKKTTIKKVASLAVAYPCKDGRQTSSLKFVSFPLQLKHGDLYAWCRAVVGDIMACEARKLCFEAQELIRVLTAYFNYKRATVIKDWVVYDLCIASWLLDADHPPNTFTSLLSKCKHLQLKSATSSSSSNSNNNSSSNNSPKQLLCADLSLLGPAMVQLYQQLTASGLWTLYSHIEVPLISLLAVMELRGVCVDTEMMRRFQNVLKKTLSALEKKARNCVGHPFLINSHPQLRQILFEELKLKSGVAQQKVALTSIGQHKSTGEGVLIGLQDQHPLPGIVLDYRQIQKLNSTYVDGILCFVRDGQLRPSWDHTAAVTGRLTSVNPNVQSVPKVATSLKLQSLIGGVDSDAGDITEVFAREPFVSEDGYSFLSADFCQIELRILAHLSGDRGLVEIFNRANDDIFTELTAQWLSKNSTAVQLAERERTKRVIYSIMYGAGKERLADYLKVSTDEAKGIMSSFLVMFPGINVFTRKCIQQAKAQGYQSTIFGRRRLLPHIQHANSQLRAQAERQAINFCVQGSAADLCKAAMLQVERALIDISDSAAKLLIQIHDELLLHVPDTIIPQIAAKVRAIMESTDGLCAGFGVSLQVPLQVSISTGKSWAHMDKHD